MGEFPTKPKPPHNVNVLQSWLNDAARQADIAAVRLRRWLGFMVLAGMLDNARDLDDNTPLFLVKGGVAMELRFDTGARVTKDFDTAYRADMGTIASVLDLALAAGYGDSTATRTELEPIRDTGSQRCDIKLPMEVAASEGRLGNELDFVPARRLDLGLTGPDTVACLPVRWQVAQKLHARTETFSPMGPTTGSVTYSTSSSSERSRPTRT